MPGFREALVALLEWEGEGKTLTPHLSHFMADE